MYSIETEELLKRLKNRGCDVTAAEIYLESINDPEDQQPPGESAINVPFVP
jgi:hypothetical protein